MTKHENPAVQRLLSGVSNPFFEQALLQALKDRKKFISTNLPSQLLPPVYLLATITREYHEKELVDNYHNLEARIREVMKEACPDMWHPELFLVFAVLDQAAELHTNPAADYIQMAWKQLTGVFDDEPYDPLAHAKRPTKTKKLKAKAKGAGR